MQGFCQAETETLWDADLTSYQRFLVYPHMDKAFASTKNKNFKEAIKEFEQAHKLVPTQKNIIFYLAQAYLEAGSYQAAIQFIEQSLLKTPGDQKLTDLLRNAQSDLSEQILAEGKQLVTNKTELRKYIESHHLPVTNVYTENAWMELLFAASTVKDNLLLIYQPKFLANQVFKAELELKIFYASDDEEKVRKYIAQLPEVLLSDPRAVEAITFQLLKENQLQSAIQLLLAAYPYTNASEPMRANLTSRLINAQTKATNPLELVDYVKQQSPALTTISAEKNWLELIATAAQVDPQILLSYRTKYPANKKLVSDLIWEQFNTSNSLITAKNLAKNIPERVSLNPVRLDELTFKLIKQSDWEDAFKLLLLNYPYTEAPANIQKKLLDRLVFLFLAHPKSVSTADLNRVAKPLDLPALRSRQAALFAALLDCERVEVLLGDFSASYEAGDWMSLGNCYQKSSPGLAQYAFEQAYQRKPDIATARALAFQAFATKDYPTALSLWKKILAAPVTDSADLIAAAITALSDDDLVDAQIWLDHYAKLGGEKSDQYWFMQARLVEKENPREAIKNIENAIALKPKTDYYNLLAHLKSEQGDTQASIDAYEKALKLSSDDSAIQTALGYAFYKQGKMKPAENLMSKAYKMRPDDSKLVEQLAYTYQHLGQNAQAIHFSELAIDYDNRLPSDKLTPEIQKQEFGLRRMHEDLSRRWTFSFDAISGNQVSATPNSPQPGVAYRSFAQAEVAYRLGNPGIDDGKTFSVYSRIFAGGGNLNSALPIYAPVLAAGLRWKPFSNQVINFALEEQIPLDHGQSAPYNTMLRASASFLNDGQYSDEWHPVVTGWPAQNLYLDAAYYLVNQQYSVTADYRVSYHQKIDISQTIEPYTHLQYNTISQQNVPDIRVGFGVRWNIWADESRYNAYASKISLGLEGQYALSTYLGDKNTVLLTLGVRW
jgi:adsorption protein A